MKTSQILALFLCLPAFILPAAAQAPPASLHGAVTDPSGAIVPGALIQLRGPGGEQRKTTGDTGLYTFPNLTPGKYLVRVIARGFTVTEKQNFEISQPTSLDVQLTIQAEAQVMNVEDEANKVTVDPAQNGGALVLKSKELEALSDDPDELASQLQAMAGPGAGPSGGQIYIDGFTAGNPPPKSSIREIRINSNPFSPEYDHPGFGRIEIFTKPGLDAFHGSAMFQFNKEFLNARSPLLMQSSRPPYKQDFFAFSLSGPIKKEKASFGFDADHRIITENAFVNATDLDSNLNPRIVNEGITTPLTRTSLTPRLDYAISGSNNLTLRYMYMNVSSDKQGIGNFSLPSQSYNMSSTTNIVQATDTMVLSPRLINETRAQFTHSSFADSGAGTGYALNVSGAFTGGAAQVGNSGNTTNSYEITNTSTFTRGTHTFKWGGRARQTFNDDASLNNFGGTFTFLGSKGPVLDANNQAIAGTSIDLTALEVYRRTLLFAGLPAAQIRALGGGAYNFTLNAGTPALSVNQFDIALFANDDWRLRPNLTLSYGLRYEAQTNIGDHGDITPRVGIAWGIDGTANKAAKTVLRAGFGIFYDRISDSLTLNADRFNGISQQSYQILSPDFFPNVPAPTSLAAARQPQNLQYLYSGIEAPRTYQANAGIERQVNKYLRFTANYITSRGMHLVRSLNINAPIDGLYPFGNPQLRQLSESTGMSRTNQLMLSPNVSYKKVSVFGFYMLSYGKDDMGGPPADAYNLHAEWGPSSFSDVRHRAVVGGSLPLLKGATISPLIFLSSGSPYSITTGRDTNLDGFAAERPALLALAQPACSGGDLKFETGFGCFNLSPAAGTPVIGRNFARGPMNATVSLRLSRTWSFGGGEKKAAAGGQPGGPMMMMAGGGPPQHGPSGPGGGGMGGGGMMGMGGGPTAGKKYALTLGVNAGNALNRANYAPPSGDLSSTYFGQYRNLAGGMAGAMGGGASTFNRKVTLSLRFAW